MPWQRVEEISEYRLNTKKLDVWLKKKWGDYDYEIEYNNGLYSFWSMEPKTKALMDEIDDKVRYKKG
ncbi:hypothetical protein MMC22_005193 [Lobaria immixta]|nr:hypothetical protein [Lobaria immixta]